MDTEPNPVIDRDPRIAASTPSGTEGIDGSSAASLLPRPDAGLLAPVAAAALLAACGGGESPSAVAQAGASADAEVRRRTLAASDPAVPPKAAAPTTRDVARFLSQASFGPRSPEEVTALQTLGYTAWLQQQFDAPQFSHVGYLDAEKARTGKQSAPEEWSYRAFWQQWLTGNDPLRARVTWALLQIFVISNIAPDLRTYAMSSYVDMLGRNAFGNFRKLLEDVTLHPAMGYYLNMLQSEKEDATRGIHPNENYAREVLQLFSIGLAKLNPDGSQVLDASGKAVPTYDETVVKGFAKAFTGWSFGGYDNTVARNFRKMPSADSFWVQPMKPWQMFHDVGTKTLLDGRVLPANRAASVDMADALDCIFNHPNVGPFIGRQLIQRLVSSNPSAAYIQRVAAVFANNGAGVRGDLRAVVRAVLLDPEARNDAAGTLPRVGKLREPVLRFAQLLRATGAKSTSGRNQIDYLDSTDYGLGQSPLLAPSVFNFYSPNYRPAGPLGAAGMVAPEFQITGETSTVGSLNFLASVIYNGGYGSGTTKQTMDLTALASLADGDGTNLINRLDLLFFDQQMTSSTRTRLATLITALPSRNLSQRKQRVKAALMLVMASPDHVIQK